MRARRKKASEERPRQRQWPAWLAAIAAAWLALEFRQLFLGQTPVFRDQLVYTWTERSVLANALRSARIPEWNDLIGFGTQFAASSANGVTYPPVWLVGAFPLPFSMDLIAALHVLWAGIGAALFARRLGARQWGMALAGIAFMTCGYVTAIAPNKIFLGIAWLPWVAWSAHRLASREPRASLALAAVIGAQLLAGDPAAALTSALLAAAIVLACAPSRLPALGRLFAATAFASVLAAAGTLPALALLPHTSRANLDLARAEVWSLHPWRLFELIWPGALGDPLDPARNLAELVANSGGGRLEPSWSTSLFVGAPVLALAACARGRGARGLLLAAGLLTVLALGAYTPVYGLYWRFFPPEQVVRYPEKHIAGALCLVCALAGASLDRALPRRALWAGVVCLCAAVVAVALGRGWLLARLARDAALLSPPLDLAQATGVALRAGLWAAGAAALVSWLLLRPKLIPLGIAVYALHAIWAGQDALPLANAARFQRVPGLLRTPLAERKPGTAPPRILRSAVVDADLLPEAWPEAWHETLYLDSAGRFGFASVPGFEGWRSREYDALWARAGRMPLDSFLTLFAIDYVALPSDLRQRLFGADGHALGTIAELQFGGVENDRGEVRWTLAPTAGVRPRAFVAKRWRFASPEEALDSVLSGRHAAGEVVLTGTGAASTPGEASGPVPCAIDAYRPEAMSFSCTSASGGYAVVADELAPGWTATVDGAPAEIFRADVLFRAVRVSPGSHQVVMRYRTPWLRTGVAISVAAWLACLGLWRTARRRAAAPPALAS